MRTSCYRCGAVYEAEMALCWSCGSTFLGPVMHRTPSQLDVRPEIITSRDLWKREWSLVEIPTYPEIHLCAGAVVLVYGPPGAGKSTMATRFLLRVKGIYVSAEEGISGALAARVQRVGLRSEDAIFVSRISIDGLVGLIEEYRPTFVVVDSLAATSFQPGDLRRIVNTLPVKAVVGVQQVTKSGASRGTLGYAHDADVVIRVESFRYQIEKSRYQSPIEGEVWPTTETPDNTGVEE